MTNHKITDGFSIFFFISFVTCNPHRTSDNSKLDVRRQPLVTNEYDSTIFEDAFRKLNSGVTLSQVMIDSFAKGLSTRAEFYDLLEKFDKQALFPKKYISFEKATESRLASWLEYPTELGTIPSTIELLNKIEYSIRDTPFVYYVYKFKTEDPHWAAKNGWMIGVVGPYFKNSNPFDYVKGIFSKFSKINETTPEKEVAWVHKNVYEK